MALKKYKVRACYTVHCYAIVEAASEEEAYFAAIEMDGGEFDAEEDCGLSDWSIENVAEVD
jgi:hypothetical protein